MKEDAYDDQYYRRWMHELPPLIHRERDRMIDVHHAILPLTARPEAGHGGDDRGPGARLPTACSRCRRADMIVHAAAHLFADGDLAGGLRNLWDIDRLLREFAERDADFWPTLRERAARHGLLAAVARARPPRPPPLRHPRYGARHQFQVIDFEGTGATRNPDTD